MNKKIFADSTAPNAPNAFEAPKGDWCNLSQPCTIRTIYLGDGAVVQAVQGFGATSKQKTTRKGGRTVKAASVQFSARSGLMGKTKRVAVNDQGRRIGSTHQRAKHADTTIKRVKDLNAEGLGYRRIAAQLAVEGTPMPWLTVRDVLKGRIRAQQPCESRKPGDPRTPRYDFPEFYWPPCG
jgi:hypothetical protein